MVDRDPGTVLVVNPGADVYGSDLQMLESVAALTEAGMRVVVLCPQPGPLVERLESRGAVVEVQGFPVVRRAYFSVSGLAKLGLELAGSARRMVQVVRRVQPDLVYVNTITIPWWQALARLMRVPVVCHVHEAEDKDNKWVLRALNSPLLLADRVILNSQTTAKVLWTLVPQLRARSVIVLNGVPDRPGAPVPRPAQPGQTRLAVLGRLSPRKAPHVVIEAVDLLRK